MKILKIILLILLICVLIPLFYVAWIVVTPFSTGKLPALKNGDLVFQSSFGYQTPAVMFASGSVYSHMGMIKIINSKPFVVEAVGPVREIKLDDWVKNGMGERISVMRVKNLKENDAQRILNYAREYYGLPYDIYFISDDERIYCSELIYKSFGKANISLGKLQRVEELNVDNFAVRELIEKRWSKYPPCSNVKDFESCYKIMMKQELVTPESIARDSDVEFIYSNYGLLK